MIAAGKRGAAWQGIVAAALLAAASGTAPAAGADRPADEAARLARWDEGHRLLDRGENARAASSFQAALDRDPADLLAAEGCLLAAGRACGLDGALAGIAARARAPGGEALAKYGDGAALRARWRYAEAARVFREARAIAAARGDAPSAAGALLAAAACLARGNRVGEARELLERQAADRAAAGGAAPRLRLEFALLEADLQILAGRFATADSLYGGVLAAARAAGCRRVACDALTGQGTANTRRRLSREAAACFRQAVTLAEGMGDRQRLAQALTSLGYEETLQRDPAARPHLERARLLATGCGFDNLLGFIQASFGSLAEAAGDRPAAVAEYRRALAAHERVGSGIGALGARQRLAYSLLMLGEYREATAQYESCLQASDTLGSPAGANWVVGGLALAQHKLGALGAAAEQYRRALALNRALGDRASEAWCLNSLGLLHCLRGDYRRALLLHDQALGLAQGLGDAEGSGRAQVSIAEVYAKLGDYERAFAHGAEACRIAQAGGFDELLREAVTALAAVCAATGRPDLAEGHLRQALAVARRWRDAEALSWALCDLAENCLDRGRRAEARAHLAEAEGRLEPTGQYALRSRVLLLRGQGSDSPREAAALAERALAAASAGSLPEREWQCLSELGVRRLAMGDTAGALACQRRAIDVVESLRRLAGLDELRRHMLRPAIVPYERTIDLLLGGARGDGAIAAALACAERSRAQALSARLRSALAHANAPAGPDRATEDLLSRIGYLQVRLQDPALGADERAAIRARVDALEREQSRLQSLAWRAAADDSPSGGGGPDGEGPARWLAALRPGERVLSYSLGAERSWLVSAAPGRLTAHPLPPREAIERKVRLFLGLWHQANGAGTGAPPPVPAAAMAAARRELHDLLLGPVAASLAPGEALVIVPDGLLHRLPFALLEGESGFLVERHALQSAPSLQSLCSLRRREAARRDGPPPRLGVLAVGCGGAGPAAGGGVARALPNSGELVTPLPGAAAEARRVAARFRAALLLTGAAAGERAFRAAPLDQCAILHIAAHGWADDVEARRSYLLLEAAARRADAASAAEEDGLLQWDEAAALPLRCSLVTLASCRSADGVLAVGEGVTGLTQAFLHAGATCVLAAQSDVPDRLSRDMMADFYRGIQRGRPAAAALQAAQVAALRRPDRAGACPWAGFVLVGDGGVAITGPAAAAPPAGRRLAGAVALAAVVLAFGCVIRARRGSKK